MDELDGLHTEGPLHCHHILSVLQSTAIVVVVSGMRGNVTPITEVEGAALG